MRVGYRRATSLALNVTVIVMRSASCRVVVVVVVVCLRLFNLDACFRLVLALRPSSARHDCKKSLEGELPVFGYGLILINVGSTVYHFNKKLVRFFA